MNDKIKIIPNYIRNCDKIVDHIEFYYNHKFLPRTGENAHEGIIPGVRSKFSTLKDDDMNDDLLNLIFKNCEFDSMLRHTYNFIQVQRYEPGEFICPHRDKYSGLQKLHLVNLTTSKVDGLVIEDGEGGLIKIYDVAGQYIDFDGDLTHWVDPVKDYRYSLVIGE